MAGTMSIWVRQSAFETLTGLLELHSLTTALVKLLMIPLWMESEVGSAAMLDPTVGVPEQRSAYVVESEQAPITEADHDTWLYPPTGKNSLFVTVSACPTVANTRQADAKMLTLLLDFGAIRGLQSGTTADKLWNIKFSRLVIPVLKIWG
jgi:hypothetical protein